MSTRPARPKGRYPHPRAILCYSRIAHILRDDDVEGSMPVLEDMADSGGRMRMGALAPLVDSCAGLLAARVVWPDWCATLDFKLHLQAPPTDGRVTALTRPLRVGKNTVLSETRLTDDDGRSVGLAHVTFSRLPRRPETPETPPPRPGSFDYTRPDEEPRLPFDEYFGIRLDPDADAFELDHHERIYNSFGSIQGGAMGALLERVAALAGQRHLGGDCRTVDLHFSYLAPATDGPFRVVADHVRAEPTGVVTTVELLDLGRDGRQCAVGTARAVLIGPGRHVLS